MKNLIKKKNLFVLPLVLITGFMVTSFRASFNENVALNDSGNIVLVDSEAAFVTCGGTTNCGTTRVSGTKSGECKRRWWCFGCYRKWVTTYYQIKRCGTGFPACPGGNAHWWDDHGSSGGYQPC